jgi:hypothetical protein
MFKPAVGWLLHKMPTGPARPWPLLLLILLVVMPAAGVELASLVRGGCAYERMQTSQFSLGYFQRVYAALPVWVLLNLMQRFELGSSGLIIERVSTSISRGSQFLALSAECGQNAFDFTTSFSSTCCMCCFPAARRSGAVDIRKSHSA